MPPAKKAATEVVVSANSFIPGAKDFVHVITRSGAKYKSAEILETHPTGLVIRTDPNGPTLAEISFIPWSAIDGVGLIGKR